MLWFKLESNSFKPELLWLKPVSFWFESEPERFKPEPACFKPELFWFDPELFGCGMELLWFKPEFPWFKLELTGFKPVNPFRLRGGLVGEPSVHSRRCFVKDGRPNQKNLLAA
jgi:hypothetical protein